MSISDGRKKHDENVGYVAYFCPLCRGLRPFRLYAVRMVDLVSSAPVGRGETVGHEAVCVDCGIRLSVNPGVFTGALIKCPPSLDDLIAQTYPGIHSAYRDRLKAEMYVKNNPYGFSSNDRLRLIREPFLILASWYASKSQRGREFDKCGGIALLLTLVILILILILAANPALSSKISGYVAPAIWTAIIAGLSMTVYFYFTAEDRFLRSCLTPLLLQGLSPLKPSSDEIDSALEELRLMKFELASKLTTESIIKRLESGRTAKYYRNTPFGKIAAVCAGILILFGVLVQFTPHDGPAQKTGDLSVPVAFKPDPSPKPKQQEIRLENGALIRSSGLNGTGSLEVRNGLDHDAAAKLVSVAGNSCLAFFYVRSKSSHTLDGVPDGQYRVQFVTGRDWDGGAGCFRQSPSCFEFQDQFPFATTTEQRSDGRYTVSKTWSVTLHAVPSGTAKTRHISQAEFQKQ